jgi:hypothetical protein
VALVCPACFAQAARPASKGNTAAASPSDLDSIISRMEEVASANPSRTRPYTMTREYKIFRGDEKDAPKTEVVAEISFVPPNVKTFRIVDSEGSGRGTGVIKHILENEAELAKNVKAYEVSRSNYDFQLLGTGDLGGKRCYILGLRPKRHDHSLFDGKAWVDAEDFHILRIEGEPSKSPSFWLRKSYVTLTFADMSGLWLPASTESVAELRVFGTYELSSRAVSHQVGDVVAMNTHRPRETRRGRQLRPQRSIGTAVIQP